MKQSIFFEYIECGIIVFFCVIPPQFTATPFVLPQKPLLWYDATVFIYSVAVQAAYEEFLYRLYLPSRFYTIYTKIVHYKHAAVQRMIALPENNGFSIIQTVCAEILPILFFALAHRYLGIISVIWAGIAAGFFRIVYCMLKKHIPQYIAVICIIFVHTVWNVLVYYWLWITAA